MNGVWGLSPALVLHVLITAAEEFLSIAMDLHGLPRIILAPPVAACAEGLEKDAGGVSWACDIDSADSKITKSGEGGPEDGLPGLPRVSGSIKREECHKVP